MIRKKHTSPRWKGFDYSSPNLYFITVCVKNRIHFLGEIQHGKMVQNPFGDIAENQWYWLETQYPYVILHEFIVMPDHVHGIIEIDDHSVGSGRDDHFVRSGRDDHFVRSGRDLTLQKIKSLPELMGAYKTTSSKMIHQSGGVNFNWQRSFHDRVIRNEFEYHAISEYILKNPERSYGQVAT